jgi:hypothetical protein
MVRPGIASACSVAARERRDRPVRRSLVSHDFLPEAYAVLGEDYCYHGVGSQM